MDSKRIEVSIKEITEKSESKKMEVSIQSYSTFRLAAKCGANTIYRSCKYKEPCSSSSSNRLRLLEAKASTP